MSAEEFAVVVVAAPAVVVALSSADARASDGGGSDGDGNGRSPGAVAISCLVAVEFDDGARDGEVSVFTADGDNDDNDDNDDDDDDDALAVSFVQSKLWRSFSAVSLSPDISCSPPFAACAAAAL